MQVSDDGGKTFRRIPEEGHKHSDNHSLAFRASDPDYLLVGTRRRPLRELRPGQELALHRQPARDAVLQGGGRRRRAVLQRLRGHAGQQHAGRPVADRQRARHPATPTGASRCSTGTATSPRPSRAIPTSCTPSGRRVSCTRVDRTTGEIVHIQPQPEPGDPPERFNWDAPILVSPHQPTRIYYASQRVWRSDDRGDSWRAVSGDLTRDQDRHARCRSWGRQWSWDNAVGRAGDVHLQHDHLAGRVADAGGSALRRHRRRAHPGLGERRRELAHGSRWARCRACPTPPSSTTSRPTCTTRTPSTWRWTTTSTATSTPYLLKSTDRGAELEIDSPGTCPIGTSCGAWCRTT